MTTPEKLGPYRIKRPLGAPGGMGEVYLAEQRGEAGWSKEVAIKRILPQLAKDPDFERRFMEEARIASQLAHPHIARVTHFDRAVDGSLYLVMDLVEGVDLHKLRTAQPNKRLDPTTVAHVGSRLAEALAYAHESDPTTNRPPVIHRDVKPRNVLIDQKGYVFLVDFGVAKAVQETGAGTRTGSMTGTIFYMAPELFTAGAIDRRVDLWALGVTLWECCVGWRPFEDEHFGSMDRGARDMLALARIQEGKRRHIGEVAPELPDALKDVIERLLAPLSERFASAHEVVDRLAPLVPSNAARRLAPLVCKLNPPARPTMEERPGFGREGEPLSSTGPLAQASPEPTMKLAEPEANATPEEVEDLPPGTVLADRYRVVRKLGAGGMGAVYEGQHIAIRRRVAIKVVHAQFADKPDVVGRFQREAQAATLIAHPNVVEVTDFGRLPDGRPFMVLEFLEGRDWEADITTEGPQPLGKVAHIAVQVCRGLAAAHASGVVHRDLKPENVFLMKREGDPCFAKIVDFGISKFHDPEAGEGELKLTQTGMALGTPYYMSPEQCRGAKDLDHRADIYGLGVMLFRAFTGVHPFDGKSYPELILQIATAEAPPTVHWRRDLPPEIGALVGRMLCKHPDHRPQSCAEVEAMLQPYVGDPRPPVLVKPGAGGPVDLPVATAVLPVSAGTPPSVAAPRSASAKWLLLGILGALAVCGALAGVALAVWFPSDDEPRAEVTPPALAGPRGSSTPPPIDTEPASTEPASTEATGTPPVPPSEPAPVHLRVEATPSGAEIRLSGQRVSNPFEADLPRGSTRHLVVRADGYQTHEAELVLDAPREIAVTLVPEPTDPEPVANARQQPRRSRPEASPVARPLAPPAVRSGPSATQRREDTSSSAAGEGAFGL